MDQQLKPIRLHGFNNLSKTLSFSFYNVHYVAEPDQQAAYTRHIESRFNTGRLTDILSEVAGIVGAKILNVARQDYDPQGGSVTMMVCDDSVPMPESAVIGLTKIPVVDDVVMHLDKSHITVHTYPETCPDKGIYTFRSDIEVSTCGLISPLKALNYLIRSLESDIVILDYRVRGFTRDVNGRKHFIDHKISTIQDFMAPDIKALYKMNDVNLVQESIFHTKMCRESVEIEDHLFGRDKSGYSTEDLNRIKQCLLVERSEILRGPLTVAT